MFSFPSTNKFSFPNSSPRVGGRRLIAGSHSETTLNDIHSIMGSKLTRIICIPPLYNFDGLPSRHLAESQESQGVEGSMMRSIIALAFTAALGNTAIAADMPVKAPPAPAPVYLWTGCYIGGNI